MKWAFLRLRHPLCCLELNLGGTPPQLLRHRCPELHALAERLVAVPASVPPQIAVAAAVFVHIAAADTVVVAYKAAAAALVPFAAGTPFAVGPVDAAVVSVAVVVAAAGQTWHFVAAFAVPLGIHSSAVDTASCNLNENLYVYTVSTHVSVQTATIVSERDVMCTPWQLACKEGMQPNEPLLALL